MFEFIELASGIRSLYGHVKKCLAEDDFWPLTAEQCKKLAPGEQSLEWFMINPSKLKKITKEGWVVNKDQKEIMLKAVNFIMKITNDLPDNSSFLERLLYTKKILPPILFTTET